MESLINSWKKEVEQSCIIVGPDGSAYLQNTGLMVWDLLHDLANNIDEQELQQTYPSLTQKDLRACRLFAYLKITNKI